MDSKVSALQADLQDTLSSYQEMTTCWIAYSGGMDSCVLLHALVGIKDKIKQRIGASHVNHGLHKHADQWEAECRAVCEQHAIQFRAFSATVRVDDGAGIEAAARAQRYALLAKLIESGDLLLTAHHANDQVETLLLNLMRGSGPDGLAGMPHCRTFAKGYLLRPLLRYPRAVLEQYAKATSLHWIEDDSNQSNQYDRNYLRNMVIPKLLTRWTGALKTMQRAMAHQANLKHLTDEIAQDDLCEVSGNHPCRINIALFAKLNCTRRKNVLRAWFKKNAMAMPYFKTLKAIDRQVMMGHKAATYTFHVVWQGAEIRGYRGKLYLMSPLPTHDPKTIMPWDTTDTITLTGGVLSVLPDVGHGIKKSLIADRKLEIRYRQGGETINLQGRHHHHKLKKLFQAEGIPTWYRDRMPLIFCDGRLVAVADLWVDSQYAASSSEPALKIIWERNEY